MECSVARSTWLIARPWAGGMPIPASGAAYRGRVPENDPLYQVLSEHLGTFLEQTHV